MVRTSGPQTQARRSPRLQERARPDMLLVSELKQALRQSGCPLCRVIRNGDRHYLAVFLREGKDDGRMLLRLLGSWGLCARHAGLLISLEPVERGDGLGTGTLYDWLLDQARRLLEMYRQVLSTEGGSKPLGWPRRQGLRHRVDRALRRLKRHESCPACEAQEQHAAHVVQSFIQALEPAAELPEIPTMYLACEGLCLPHWRAVMHTRQSSAVHQLVEAKQREVVAAMKRALEAELDCRVGDGASRNDGEREPAYARALAAVAGQTEWRPPEGC